MRHSDATRAARRIFRVLVLTTLFLPGTALSQTVTFEQIDWELDGNITTNSDWGAVNLTFTGSPAILYFNLQVNGSWQVQDIPVLSTQGFGNSQTQRFYFDLGNTIGVDVSSLTYAMSLTAATTGAPPVGNTPAGVGNGAVVIANAGLDVFSFPTAPPPAGATVGGPVADPALHTNENFPNQEAGALECAPTAVSNSLQFLNFEHALGLTAGDISIAQMKVATKWNNGNWIWHDESRPAGQKNAWWEDKQEHLDANNIALTTRQILPWDIGKLAAEIDRGQDVEAELAGHTVAITGIADLGGGKYSVTVAHDKEQGQAGGTVEETATWDGNTASWGGALAPYGLNYFIVECPKVLDDVHATVPGDGTGGGTFVQIGTPEFPAIPADFFDPGSDPFTGQVAMQGLTPDTISTRVQRYGEPVAASDPAGTQGAVEVEIVALDLVATQPIEVGINGGASTELWDVELFLAAPLPGEHPQRGVLTAMKTHDNGGWFDADFFVAPVFLFTRVNPPHDQRQLDFSQLFGPLHLSATSVPFVHTLDPSLQFVAQSNGLFVPGIEEILPGDPSSQQPVSAIFSSDGGSAVHEVIPVPVAQTPVASDRGLLLLALLLVAAALGALAWRRRLQPD